MSDKRLILASTSPRRRKLLSDLSLEFEVAVPDFEEQMLPGVSPAESAMRNAEGKARSVAGWEQNALVVGADTVVFSEGQSLGKPSSSQDAFRMLSFLSGKRHAVYTGVCVINSDTGRSETDCEETLVDFRTLTPSEIWTYIELANPIDRAGAYSIECKGAMLVRRIEGCYYNVVGLPLNRLHNLLVRFGMRLFPARTFELI